MAAPNKETLIAQAVALGVAVDDSLTKRELTALITDAKANPDAGALAPASSDDRTPEERAAAVANPDGTPETPATEHADEPGSHDHALIPDTTVDDADAATAHEVAAALTGAQSAPSAGSPNESAGEFPADGVERVAALKGAMIEVVTPRNMRQFGRYANSRYARPRRT